MTGKNNEERKHPHSLNTERYYSNKGGAGERMHQMHHDYLLWDDVLMQKSQILEI